MVFAFSALIICGEYGGYGKGTGKFPGSASALFLTFSFLFSSSSLKVW
jgi:hypothetical protein